MSPTERSLAYLRKQGYLVAVTEHWNGYAKIRQDLFGFVDLLALKEGETLAVQCTSDSNVSARIRKIAGHENTQKLREAGWRIWVMGWKQKAAQPRIVDLS